MSGRVRIPTMSTRFQSICPIQNTQAAWPFYFISVRKWRSQAKVYFFYFLLLKKERKRKYSVTFRCGLNLLWCASKSRFASVHQDTRPGDLHPFSNISEPLHCVLYCQEAFSLGGSGLYKLGRAVNTVVMNITVGLRSYAGCIICFTNLSWADWISLSFFFNISRFWNWKNKIFHSWEKRINLGNEPRWHPHTIHFLDCDEVSIACAPAAGTRSVSCTWSHGKKRGSNWESVILGGYWPGA